MYINVYKILLLVCMCGIGIFWISCSGNSDDSEETEVLLNVSKNTLIADGKDVITFTVTHAGVDITADAVIRSVMDGQILDGSTFSTSKVGMYAFEASYGKCPAGMTRLNYLISSSYEGIVYMMAFHVNGSPADPMVIDQSSILSNKFGLSAYPSCVVDMRGKMGLSENYDVMRSVFNESLDNYPAHCGVGIQSQYDGQATVTVKVKSEKDAEYRLILYAVEDGLKYQQNDGGIYRDYTHNHVVRKLLSASVDGDKLGQIAAGMEKGIEYTVIMDEGWKAENISFYALVTDKNGYVNNLAVCKAINGDTDYEYVND